MLNNFIAACLARQRTIILLLLLVLASGGIAYVTIPKESQPDVPIPTVYVLMVHDGISPEDGERLLIRPMEKELRAIEGIKEMTSHANEGSASVVLEFEAGFDKEQALNDVREKVDLAKAELPAETEEPTVHEVNFSDIFPLIILTLSGNVPEHTLIKTARDLRDKLEGISEILEVRIPSDREEVIDVIIDPVALETYDLRYEEIFSLVAGNNRLVAAGILDPGSGRIPVKMPGLYETWEDILSQPVKVDGDRVIRIKDVATLRKTFKDAQSYSRVNGMPAVTLEVVKRSGENIISAVDKVRDIVEEEKQDWPEALEVGYMQDQSEEIKNMLTDLQNNMLSAIILVMIVVVGALGVRTGILVGIAIPGSFLAGILVLHMMDLTVNIVVLFSLILSVGMLVDGAIVVTEFADRKMTEGINRVTAYRQASQRMAMPIIASTATTLVAFAPLLFWPGIVGEFMKYLPITLIATLSASLIMALVFVPTLGALVGKPGSASPKTMRSLDAAEGGNLDELGGITGFYIRILKKILHQPSVVVLVAILTLLGVYFTYFKLGKGKEFFPDVEPEMAALYVRIRGNLSIDEIDEIVRKVENRVLEVKGIESLYCQSGISFQGDGIPEDAHGVIQLEFKDWDKRPKAAQIMSEIRMKTRDIAGIVLEERKQEAGPPTGKPIQMELSSRFPDQLEPAIELIRAKLESMEGLIDIDDSRPVAAFEWQIDMDRAEASRFGVDYTTVGNAVQFVTNGLKIGSYRPDDADDEVDIRLRYPLENRSLDEIGRLRVNVGGKMVPVSSFIQRKPALKVGSIERANSKRVLEVNANVEAGILSAEKVDHLRKWIEEEANLPSSIHVEFKGEDEEQAESQVFLLQAFVVALFAMAIILVTQFNSFYQAFLILTAVIFSTVGVFLGLLITGQPFGIVMNGIGVISLAGIVVNNNIVLIDTFDYHKHNGAPTMEAVLRTSAQRFRPVMLTTITTILGLLPMVMKINIDFINREVTYGAPSTQWWVQLAISVAFGLAFATLLTLVLTPCLLQLGNRLYKTNIMNKGELMENSKAGTSGG